MLTRDQKKHLESIGAAIRYMSVRGRPPHQAVRAEVMDTATGRVWHTAYGTTEDDAAAAAYSTMNQSARPQTPSEIAEENMRLRAQLARLAELDAARDAADPPAEIGDELAREEIIRRLDEAGVQFDRRLGRDKLIGIARDAEVL